MNLCLSLSLQTKSTNAFTFSNSPPSPFHSSSSSFRASSALNEKVLKSGYDTKDGYERFLYSAKQKKKNYKKENSLKRKITKAEEDEDGYRDMMMKNEDNLERITLLQKCLLAPLKIGFMIIRKTTIPRDVPEPGTLILVRHGESEWNANKTFTVSVQ